MRARQLVEYAFAFVVVVLAASLLLGQLFGQPVLVGYVETGSMRPALAPGDGFIAIPTVIDSTINQGDVIVFHAETLQGGGLTTHRVVGETAEGFITRGDANPVTDQSSGEPPVSRDQIVATVLQVNGNVVVIPNLGLLVTGINDILTGIQRQLAVIFGTRAFLGPQGLAYLFFGAGVLSYIISELRESQGRHGRRDRRRQAGMLDARLVVVSLTVLLMVMLTVGMVVPSTTQSFDLVSSENDAPGVGVIQQGTNESVTYTIPSNGLLPAVTYLEPTTEGITVNPQRLYIPPSSRANATITIQAPAETGPQQRRISERRYIGILPVGVIDFLYGIHPWAPIIAIDLFAAIGFAAGGAALVGWGPIRLDTPGSRSLRSRLRRWLR